MTTGTAECEFKEDGLIKMSFDQIMSGFTRCTLGFCGIGVIPSFVFYAPNLMKKEDLENKLKEYDDYIKEKIILGEN